ncbi:MAG: PqqD family protein [Spirochaetaceae bacterium]|nr:PqqD family protein [Spirochaetaceae bacterium]
MKKQKIKKNYMDIKFLPEKSISWKEEENLVILDVENKGFFNRIAQKFFGQPKISHISLDKYGSTLWQLLDGENTVFQIVKKMEEAFPTEKDKMLNRVITFLHNLQVNKYIMSNIFENVQN